MYFVQQWYRLADEALEDALYDSAALRDFVGIDLSRQSVPDATTLLHFRHRLEREALTKILFAEINAHLEHLGLLLRRGTLEDATLIAAPPSTKNRDKKRDPDMHQSKKGNQWYLGMKAHIGADAEFGAVHTLETTSGNESDVSQTPKLLHGQEQAVHLDAGYVGVTKRPEVVDAIAAGTIRADVEWFVAARRRTLDKLPRNVSTLSPHSLRDFYVTTSGSPVSTGVGTMVSAPEVASSCEACMARSGLMCTAAGGRATARL